MGEGRRFTPTLHTYSSHLKRGHGRGEADPNPNPNPDPDPGPGSNRKARPWARGGSL